MTVPSPVRILAVLPFYLIILYTVDTGNVIGESIKT